MEVSTSLSERHRQGTAGLGRRPQQHASTTRTGFWTGRLVVPKITHSSPTLERITLQQAVAEGFGGYSTLRAHIAAGRLPAQRYGRRWSIRRVDLEALGTPSSGAIDTLDKSVQRIIISAPHLTEEQRSTLRKVLGGDVR